MATPTLMDDGESDDDQDYDADDDPETTMTPETDDDPDAASNDDPETDTDPDGADDADDPVATVDGPDDGAIDMDADEGGLLGSINTKSVIVVAVGVVVAVIVYRMMTSGGSAPDADEQEAAEGNANPEREPAGPNRDEMTPLQEDAHDMKQMGIGSEAGR